MPECSECDKSFDSERGLNIHIGIKHTNKDNCKLNQTNCKECGREFEYYPSNKKGEYCSSCQKDRPWVGKNKFENSQDPEHIGNSSTVTCDWCGKEITRYDSEINENNFCGRDCQSAWLSEEFLGDNHPNWDPNYPTNKNYGKGWRSVKLEALERDNYTCQKCGIHKSELGKNPSVHHIKPVRTFKHEQNAHRLTNVISLCPECHREEEQKIRNHEIDSLQWIPDITKLSK